MHPDHNPFATRHIRPDASLFVFPGETTARHLVAQLAQHRWYGQIIGPHGTGKSTLLQTLAPEWRAAGRDVVYFTQRQGETRLREPAADPWTANTLVVVDGYEQLGWRARRRLGFRCCRQRSGLLVTAHSSVGLPTLWETRPSLALAQSVAARLLSGHPPLISAADVREAFERHAGNLRETLFHLYDLFEWRRRSATAP